MPTHSSALLRTVDSRQASLHATLALAITFLAVWTCTAQGADRKAPLSEFQADIAYGEYLSCRQFAPFAEMVSRVPTSGDPLGELIGDRYAREGPKGLYPIAVNMIQTYNSELPDCVLPHLGIDPTKYLDLSRRVALAQVHLLRAAIRLEAAYGHDAEWSMATMDGFFSGLGLPIPAASPDANQGFAASQAAYARVDLVQALAILLGDDKDGTAELHYYSPKTESILHFYEEARTEGLTTAPLTDCLLLRPYAEILSTDKGLGHPATPAPEYLASARIKTLDDAYGELWQYTQIQNGMGEPVLVDTMASEHCIACKTIGEVRIRASVFLKEIVRRMHELNWFHGYYAVERSPDDLLYLAQIILNQRSVEKSLTVDDFVADYEYAVSKALSNAEASLPVLPAQ